jgi:hypothetical protein
VDLNFPKLKFGKKSLLNLTLTICITITLFLVFSIPFVFSVLMAIVTYILFSFAFIFPRRYSYYKFLDEMGDSISNSKFYEEEYSMSAVPFRGYVLACSARIQNDKLMFGRSRHYRIVGLDKIDNIEFEHYCGHKVAKITLENNSNNQVDFYLPWTDLLKQEVELCESTKQANG